MRRFLLFAALLLCASLPACQCADPPPVGPVEDDSESAHRMVPADGPGQHPVA